jgi:hypothetical protein
MSIPLSSFGYSAVVTVFSALAFVAGMPVVVLLAEPPGVIVAMIAVVVVGVLLRTFAPGAVWRRARWPPSSIAAPLSGTRPRRPAPATREADPS